ncbi:uncharacterized protein LOC132064781 [Lycium ferocissimum]|uniref:uncharacterized protein LOC132064781 n=1 Tax=Lycium ferocissimum TaxID=112874 RepID=UPI0028165309|nr:uncharacterized protein LOC132064781 [Lycium ferocissimum]
MVAFVQGNEDGMKEKEASQKEKDREFNKSAKSTSNFSHGRSQGGGESQLFKNRSSGPASSEASAPIPRKRHEKEFRMGMDVYLGCDQEGHFQRDFPSARQGTGGNMAQSTNSVAHNFQAQSGCGAVKSSNTGGGQTHLYALAGCQDT